MLRLRQADRLRDPLDHGEGGERHLWCTDPPNAEQLEALRDFAARHGRKWKAELRDCCMTGIYPGDADSRALQQVRNQLGPSWLVKFRPGTKQCA
jgi:hypothetical protein